LASSSRSRRRPAIRCYREACTYAFERLIALRFKRFTRPRFIPAAEAMVSRVYDRSTILITLQPSYSIPMDTAWKPCAMRLKHLPRCDRGRRNGVRSNTR
jgi:hypothetical protein